MNPRGIQLFAFVARTCEIRVLWTDQVATFFTDRPSIEMGNHRSELEAENAVGAADRRLRHMNSRDGGESRETALGRELSSTSTLTAGLGINLYPDAVNPKWPSGAVAWHGSATRQKRRIVTR